jgi:hypothetical protein
VLQLRLLEVLLSRGHARLDFFALALLLFECRLSVAVCPLAATKLLLLAPEGHGSQRRDRDGFADQSHVHCYPGRTCAETLPVLRPMGGAQQQWDPRPDNEACRCRDAPPTTATNQPPDSMRWCAPRCSRLTPRPMGNTSDMVALLILVAAGVVVLGAIVIGISIGSDRAMRAE